MAGVRVRILKIFGPCIRFTMSISASTLTVFSCNTYSRYHKSIRNHEQDLVAARKLESPSSPSFLDILSLTCCCYSAMTTQIDYAPTIVFFLPSRRAQLDKALDLKTQGCGFDSRAGQANKY